MRAKRVDSNLTDIVTAARKVGLRVFVRNDSLGDVDVQCGLLHEVWEVKAKNGRLTKLQQQFRFEGWQIRLVRTVEDVVKARREMAWFAETLLRTKKPAC